MTQPAGAIGSNRIQSVHASDRHHRLVAAGLLASTGLLPRIVTMNLDVAVTRESSAETPLPNNGSRRASIHSRALIGSMNRGEITITIKTSDRGPFLNPNLALNLNLWLLVHRKPPVDLSHALGP
jgi:hypothetical protein